MDWNPSIAQGWMSFIQCTKCYLSSIVSKKNIKSKKYVYKTSTNITGYQMLKRSENVNMNLDRVPMKWKRKLNHGYFTDFTEQCTYNYDCSIFNKIHE